MAWRIFSCDPARIEGLLTCHFIAMLLSSLIERTIRQAMTDTGLQELSLYPEDRGCAAPTTARILEIFAGVARHELTAPDGQVLRTFHPELTELQRQVLDLLDIPATVYSPSPQMPLKALREVRNASPDRPALAAGGSNIGGWFPIPGPARNYGDVWVVRGRGGQR